MFKKNQIELESICISNKKIKIDTKKYEEKYNDFEFI